MAATHDTRHFRGGSIFQMTTSIIRNCYGKISLDLYLLMLVLVRTVNASADNGCLVKGQRPPVALRDVCQEASPMTCPRGDMVGTRIGHSVIASVTCGRGLSSLRSSSTSSSDSSLSMPLYEMSEVSPSLSADDESDEAEHELLPTSRMLLCWA